MKDDIKEEERIELRAEADGNSTEASEKDPFIGTTVADRIQILEHLGAGGMSTVYKARHLLLDRIVAVKIIHPGHAKSQAIRRFQQEAKAATALNHPNIATVREFGIDREGNPYLVMDYVEGRSLADEIKARGALEPQRVTKLGIQICDGLEHAHGSNIVHRDLKPANLILSKSEPANEESLKIVDFGIAKVLGEEAKSNLTQTGDIFGTPNYMSPEQCLGNKVDHRSDVYSLGCLLFECLEGKPPFEGESAFETLSKHVGETPKFANTKLPANLRNVILRCLEKDAAKRYQTIKAVKEDLLRASAGQHVSYKAKRPAHFLKAGGTLISAFVGGTLAILLTLTIVWSFIVSPLIKLSHARQQSSPMGPVTEAQAKIAKAIVGKWNFHSSNWDGEIEFKDGGVYSTAWGQGHWSMSSNDKEVLLFNDYDGYQFTLRVDGARLVGERNDGGAVTLSR